MTMTREEQMNDMMVKAFWKDIEEGNQPDSADAIEVAKIYERGYQQGWQDADAHPNWISVEDELPKENQRVRAWSLENNEEYLCDYHDGIFEDFYGYFHDGVITHWMEIVPPRNEE